MQGQLIIAVAVVVCTALLIRSLDKRRDALRHKLRILLRGEAAYILVSFLGIEFCEQQHMDPLIGLIAGIFAGMIVVARAPRRSRHIPAQVRRRVIAQFEKKTGTKFDPAVHEIDHIVPFAKGGGHTFDNLRVLTKGDNRQKSDKSPWWDILG